MTNCVQMTMVFRFNDLYCKVVTGKQRLSALSNVHYHANVECPLYSYIYTHDVQVPDKLKNSIVFNLLVGFSYVKYFSPVIETLVIYHNKN